MNELSLKTINDIKNMKFLIKGYQRGYRWDSKQVKNLLDDLQEFRKSEGEMYCLQPIIVGKISEDEYEVIDGQQRLTTIYILLKYLKKEMYKIKYETRVQSEEFLSNIDSEIEESNDIKCIDYYFMNNAYKTIKEWFANTSEKEKDGYLEGEIAALLIGGEHKVKFIWYKIDDNEVEKEKIFNRINVGKILLSN